MGTGASHSRKSDSLVISGKTSVSRKNSATRGSSGKAVGNAKINDLPPIPPPLPPPPPPPPPPLPPLPGGPLAASLKSAPLPLQFREGKQGIAGIAEDATKNDESEEEIDLVDKNNRHHTHSTQWAPPADSWDSGNGLPYGWEGAVDKEGKPYYINHVEKVTTRDDPRDDPDYVEPPQPREVELARDDQMGFGFVAGSEKPVIVRFVTEGGPSEDKLLPGDQIIKVNGEDVKKAAREHVIELVRSCKTSVSLTVCQPYTDNSTRKSALLTAAKKAKLKSNPSRVRFAEAVIVNGAPVATPSTHESYIPFMPNVLKVFLENGQTKSFKYDNKTTVKDVLNALQEKLNITCVEHFALVLLNMKNPSQKTYSLLQETDSLAEIAARPGSQHFKCLFRVAFVPKDAYDLLRKDNTAFEYYFTQCCNDVIQGRFASDLKYDVALRLAALHIHQHALSSSNTQTKISVKAIEKECGLERFVPQTLMDTMKGKDLRKMLSHYIKANQSLAAPGQKQLTALQAKLHYLKIVGELRSFGTKCFMATLVEKKTEAMLVVGPKCGVAVVTNIKNNTRLKFRNESIVRLSSLATYEQLEAISLSKESDTMQRIDIHLKNNDSCTSVSMLNEVVNDFVAMVEGYFHLFVDKTKMLLRNNLHPNNNTDPNVPPYHSKHQVLPAPWSYATDSLNEGSSLDPDKLRILDRQRSVDFGQGPPSYQESCGDSDEEGKIQVPQIVVPPAPAGREVHPARRYGKLHWTYPEDIKENGKPEIRKPNELRTSDFLIHAPLASPDASNISGSSESSLNNAASPDGVSGGLEARPAGLTELSERLGGERGSLDGSRADTDSLSDSVATVIGGTYQNGATPESPATTAADMNSATPEFDSRFGLSSFSTFAATDSPSAQTADSTNSNEASTSLSEGDVKNNNRRPTSTSRSSRLSTQDDSLSETDTESTVSGGYEGEKRPLITDRDEPLYHDNDATRAAQDDAPSESDDTDSLSTPTDSPSKGRLQSLNVTPSKSDQERPQSFGLHSPDQLPQSESDFNAIASSFGLHSPDNVAPTEKLHPSYNPRLFCDGGLYLDPDIIDLTLIPPPKTPDQEALIDFSFSAMNTPPPGFTDNGSPQWRQAGDRSSWASDHSAGGGGGVGGGATGGDFLPPGLADLPTPIREHIDQLVFNDEDLGNQLAVIDALMIDEARKRDHERESGIESETDSGNETISSENVDYSACLTESLISQSELSRVAEETMVPPFPDVQANQVMDVSDIDAFIASVTVPPPPKASPPEELQLPPPADASFLSIAARSSASQQQQSEVDGGKVGATPRSADDDDVFFPPPPEVSKPQVPKTPSWEKFVAMHASASCQSLEEEFAMLVIPPPPAGEMTELLGDIPIVPPVNVKTPSPLSDNNSPPRITDHKLPAPQDFAGKCDGAKNESVIRQQVRDEIEKEKETVDMTDPSLAFERLSIRERIASLESPKLQRAAAAKPPLAPNKHSSSESPPPSVHSPGGTQVQAEVNARRPFLWRPTEVRSADSSPVHRGKEFPPSPSPLSSRTESTGTLSRNKRVPPPPPPRRSSMPVAELTNQSPSPPAGCQRSISADPEAPPQRTMPQSLVAEIRSRACAMEAKKRNYVNVTVSHTHSNSETAINKLTCENDNASPSPVSGLSASANPSAASSPVGPPTANRFVKTPASKTASLDNAELEKIKRYRVPDTRRNPRSASAVDLRRGSYEPPQKDYYTKASSSKSKRAPREDDDESLDLDGSVGKFKGRRSPSFTRKLLAFEFKKEKAKDKDRMWANSSDASSDAGESDATGSTGSPKSIGRSNTFNSAAPQKAGGSASGSPRGSPIIHRHASLSKMADRALSPLRNLFGGSGGGDRTSSAESDAGSAPPSPHVMRSSNLPRTNIRPFGSSAAVQNNVDDAAIESTEEMPGSAFRPVMRRDQDTCSEEQGKDNTRRGAHLRMPMMPSSSSDSDVSPTLLQQDETDWPSVSDTEPKTFRTFQVNSPRTTRANQSPSSPRTSVRLSPQAQPQVQYESQGQTEVTSRSPIQASPGSRLPLWKGTTSPVASQGAPPTTKTPGAVGQQPQVQESPQPQPYTPQQHQESHQSPSHQYQQQRHTPPPPLPQQQKSLQQQLQEQLQQKLQKKQAVLQDLKTDPEVAALKNEMATARTEAIAKLAAVMKHDVKSPSPTTSKRMSHFHRSNITPQDVASKIYKGDNVFKEADVDVQHLIFAVDDTCYEVKKADFECQPDNFVPSKDRLVGESRQFVTDSKLLVSSATQSLDNLVSNINNSMHTLSRIVHHCQSSMRSMTSTSQAVMLGAKVKDVAEAYKTTISAAHTAAGRPLSDPSMKMLMRQATNLASILSMLMKTLKVLDNS